jgi:death-on-curing protein
VEDSGKPVVFPSVDDICSINADIITSFGGWLVANPNLRPGFDLQCLLGTLQYPVIGFDPYPTLVDKAAFIAWYILTRHPFHDTNKRTSVEAAIEFLELNDVPTHFDSADVIATVTQVDGGGLTYEDFRQWIAHNVGA